MSCIVQHRSVACSLGKRNGWKASSWWVRRSATYLLALEFQRMPIVWPADRRFKGPTRASLYWMKFVGWSVAVMMYIRSAVRRRRHVQTGGPRQTGCRCLLGVGTSMYQGTLERHALVSEGPSVRRPRSTAAGSLSTAWRQFYGRMMTLFFLTSRCVYPSVRHSGLHRITAVEDDNGNALAAIRPVGVMCNV